MGGFAFAQPWSDPAAALGPNHPHAHLNWCDASVRALHAAPPSCLVGIWDGAPGVSQGGVYNLTEWASSHPGGAAAIHARCGTTVSHWLAAATGHAGAAATRAPMRVGDLVPCFAPGMEVAPGEEVVIHPGDAIAVEGDLTVRGTLRCAEGHPANALEAVLLVGRIVVQDGGAFVCGTADAPLANRVSVHLRHDGEEQGIAVLQGGTWDMHGDVGTSGFVRLGAPASAGSTGVILRSSANALPFGVGDDVVITSTRYNTRSATNGHAERSVVAVTSRGPGSARLELSEPLLHDHFGGPPQTYEGSAHTVDQAAYVFTLRRNLRVVASGDTSTASSSHPSSSSFGHVIVHRGAIARVSAVEFQGLGDSGVLGRYPFHFHRAGDVHGQYLKHCSIHHSSQRCVVVHSTRNALVEGNTCFHIKGHGIFLEDHDEVGNTIKGNLVVHTMLVPQPSALLRSEWKDKDVDRFPSPAGIWISHPSNDVIANTVIGSHGTGIWFAFVRGLCCTPEDVCTTISPPNPAACSTFYTTPSFAPSGAVDDNTAIGCVVGMTWDGGPIAGPASNPLNPADRELSLVHYDPLPQVPVFKRNHLYKNLNLAMYFRGEQVIFEDLVSSDNGMGVLSGFNAVYRNSLFVGWSRNADPEHFHNVSHEGDPPEFCSRCGNRGQLLHNVGSVGTYFYDGPAVLENVHFAGYPSVPVVISGTRPRQINPIPLGCIAASERFVNWINGVTFEGPGLPWVPFSLSGLFKYFTMSQAAAAYDTAGSLTYQTTTTRAIVADWPINTDATCVRTNLLTNSMSCAYEVGMLQRSTENKNVADVVIRTAIGEDADVASLSGFNTMHSNEVQMILNRGYAYHYVLMEWVADKHDFYFRADALSTLSPPIYFHFSQRSNCPANTRHRIGLAPKYPDDGVFDAIPEVDSEAAVLSASSGAVYYDGDAKLVVLRVAADRLRVRKWMPKPAAENVEGRYYAGSPSQYESVRFGLKCCPVDGSGGGEECTPPELQRHVSPLPQAMDSYVNESLMRDPVLRVGDGAYWNVIAGKAKILDYYDLYPTGEVEVRAVAYAANGAMLEVTSVVLTNQSSNHKFVLELPADGSVNWSVYSKVAVLARCGGIDARTGDPLMDSWMYVVAPLAVVFGPAPSPYTFQQWLDAERSGEALALSPPPPTMAHWVSGGGGGGGGGEWSGSDQGGAGGGPQPPPPAGGRPPVHTVGDGRGGGSGGGKPGSGGGKGGGAPPLTDRGGGDKEKEKEREREDARTTSAPLGSGESPQQSSENKDQEGPRSEGDGTSSRRRPKGSPRERGASASMPRDGLGLAAPIAVGFAAVGGIAAYAVSARRRSVAQTHARRSISVMHEMAKRRATTGVVTNPLAGEGPAGDGRRSPRGMSFL